VGSGPHRVQSGRRVLYVGSSNFAEDEVRKRLDDIFPGYKAAPEHYAW